MFDLSLIAFVVGIAGLMVGLLGLMIAEKTRRDAWRIPKESGAFRKPRLSLSVFGCPLGVGYPDNEDWCFIHPGQPDEAGFFPVQFTVVNTGDATSENVDLIIWAP